MPESGGKNLIRGTLRRWHCWPQAQCPAPTWIAASGSGPPTVPRSRPEMFAHRADSRHQIGNASRQKVAKKAKSGAQHRFRLKLPGDGGSWLQNRQRRGRKDVALGCLDRLVQRLVSIVRNRSKRSFEPRNLIVWVQRIRVERIPHPNVQVTVA